MQEVLATLIPLLMNGGDLSEILTAVIGGTANGAASMDGLQQMYSSSLYDARLTSGIASRPSDATIAQKSDSFLDRIGVNPYTNFGQSASTALQGFYHVAPDIVGGAIGIPNSKSLFSTIGNGAGGITHASTNGIVDIFNPYSVKNSYESAMGMAQTIHGMSLREDGGYNVEFSHGLNMEELGKTSQRLLSSSIAYKEYNENGEETGKTLDLLKKEDADKFKNNLDKFGSKINETASLLAKITGSIESALAVMDSIAGGNFLGGSAKQAMEIANRASRFATTIRATAAIAGEDPKKIYQHMEGVQNGIAAAVGLDPELAKQTGISNTFQNGAYTSALAYGAWAASNPNASQQEKAQAMLASSSRTTQYYATNGSRMAALVADNAQMFSSDQLQQIQKAFKEGRPNDVIGMVKNVVGEGAYNDIFSDDQVYLATRTRASQNNYELLSNIDASGMEGQLAQSARTGGRHSVNMALLDTRKAWNKGANARKEDASNGGFDKRVSDAEDEALKELALKSGLTKEAVAKMTPNSIKSFLTERHGSDKVEEISMRAKVTAANKEIDAVTMSADDEKTFAETLRSEITNSKDWDEESKKKLLAKLESGDLQGALSDFTSIKSGQERTDFRNKLTNGKMFQQEAANRKAANNRALEPFAEYTSEERFRALENDAKAIDIGKTGEIVKAGFVGDGEAAGTAIKRLTNKASELFNSGRLDKTQYNDYKGASDELAFEMFKDGVGGLEGNDLDNFQSLFSSHVAGVKQHNKDKSVVDITQDIVDAIIDPKNDEQKSIQRQYISLLGDEKFQKLQKSGELEKKLKKAQNGGLFGGAALLSDEHFNETARSLGTTDYSEEEISKEAASSVLDDVLGDKVGNLSGKGLKSLKNTVSEMYASSVRSGKKSGEALQEIFGTLSKPEEELTEEQREQKKKIIETIGQGNYDKLMDNGGGETLQKFFSDLGNEKSAISMQASDKAYAAKAIDAMHKHTKSVGSLDSVKKMEEMVKGDKNLDTAKSLDEFFQTAEKGDLLEKDVNGKTKGIEDLKVGAISDTVKQLASGLTDSQVDSIARSAIEKKSNDEYKGSWKDAIKSATEDLAKRPGMSSDDKEKLSKAQEQIEGAKDQDVGEIVDKNAVKQVRESGTRNNAYSNMIAASNMSLASLAFAANKAQMSGQHFSAEQLQKMGLDSQQSAAIISYQDNAIANASQNRFSNAINVGGTSFKETTIEGTKKALQNLNELMSGGELKLTEETFNSEESANQFKTRLAEEMKKKNKNVGQDEIDSAYATAAGAVKTGQLELLNGKEGIESIKNADSSKIIDIAKSGAREGSDAVKIAGMLSELLKKLGPVISGDGVKVNGDVKVTGSVSVNQ